MTRVDKADILEMTVCHLTKLRHQQPVSMPTNDRGSYASGFHDCAREVTGFLYSNGLIDEGRLADLSRHLQSTLNSQPGQLIQGNRSNSTPLRAQPMSNPLERTPYHITKISPIQASGYASNNCSPIGSDFHDGTFDGSFSMMPYPTPTMASKFRNSSFTDSARTSANTTMSSLEISSSSGSFFVPADDADLGCHEEGKSVNIGTGKVNKIGHVIADPVWRPW